MNTENLIKEIIDKLRNLNEIKVGKMPMILGPIHFKDETGKYKHLEKIVSIGIEPIGIDIDINIEENKIIIQSKGILLLEDDIERIYNTKLTQEEITLLDNFEDPFIRARIRKRYPKIVRLYKYSKYSIGRLNKYYKTSLKLTNKGRFYYVETILDIKDGEKTVENVLLHVKALAIFLRNFNKLLGAIAGYRRFKI
ncbi:MAG: hypothetical protein QXL89_02900 [Nitrososphaeria archaeon]